jgi:hypothetical protein
MVARAQVRFGSLVQALVLTAACSAEDAPPAGGNAGGSAGTGVVGGAAGSGAGAPPSAGTSGAGAASVGGAGAGAGGTPSASGSGGAAGSSGAGGASGGSAGAPGGAFRKTITLDTSASGANVPSDVDKYPLAVQLDATNFDFAQAQPMGTDVHFEKMDGSPLPFSIEHWDAAGKTAALWVKLDKVTGNMAGQSIRLVWGAPGAAADSKAVFSTADGFYGVWHLDEDGNTTAGGYKDASGHEAHGTGVNMVAGSRVAARVGKGIDLDNPTGQNTARWVRVEGEKASAFNPGPPITVSVWALAHSYPIQSYETIMSKGDTSWSLQRVQYDDTGYQSCLLAGGQPGYHFCIYDFAKQPRVTEQWLHFMVVLEEPSMKLYINGTLNAQNTGTNWNQGNHPLGIGNQTQFDGRRQWDGIIDEARVMQAARSLSWAKLDFETQKAGQKAITYGATEAN